MVMRQKMLVMARAALTPTAPDAPSGLSTSLIADDQIRIDWTDNSNNETGFKIERSVGGGAYSLWVTTGANIETRTATGLAAETQYCFKVSATNDTGDSAQIGPSCKTTPEDSPPCSAPDAPSSMDAVTASSSSITLSWNDNSDDETGFEVYMDGSFEKSVGAGSTGTTVSGLSEGTTYTFKVRAVKTTCSPTAYSGFSNSDAQYTKLASPSAMGFQDFRDPCPAVTGFVRLTWSENSSNEANIELYKDGGLNRTLAANSTTIDVFSPNEASVWKVRAIHSTIPDSGFSGNANVPECP